MWFSIRALEDEDLRGLFALINAHSLAVTRTQRAIFDSDGDLRTARYIPSAAERFVAVARDGTLGGFVYAISRPPHIVCEVGCIVHPDHWQSGVASDLLGHVEGVAQAAIDLAPDGVRVVMQIVALGEDAHLANVLGERGYARVREWVHLELELDAPPAVELPAGVTIRVMNPRHDWPAVGAAMDSAFADHWGELGPDRRTLLEEDDAGEDSAGDADAEGETEQVDDPYSNSLGLCFVAESAGEVIGSCLCNARTIEWPDSGKLGSLSVRREYRKRGTGRSLTAFALNEFHRRGIRRVITDTDSASFTGANRLYRRLGFRPYRYEQVYEKQLRPGKEWRALEPEDLAL